MLMVTRRAHDIMIFGGRIVNWLQKISCGNESRAGKGKMIK